MLGANHMTTSPLLCLIFLSLLFQWEIPDLEASLHVTFLFFVIGLTLRI